MTDTEKLRERLKEVQVFDSYLGEYYPLTEEEIDQILKICKEEGLKFVPDKPRTLSELASRIKELDID